MPRTENKHGFDDAARENWARYRYGIDRGHTDYTAQAQRCEGMYLGGGEQWRAEDKRILEAEGRPFYEFNQIMPAINTALGYQIANRMDISLRPRGADGDAEVAKTLTKIIKQISDSNHLHWQETQMFGDGLIEQRGYIDVRLRFDNNIKGDVVISSIDPRDAIPDPDAKSYNPDDWADFTWARWLTLNEIWQIYGEAARKKVEEAEDPSADYGDGDGETERNKFGGYSGLSDAYYESSEGIKRYRVIDRQYWVYEMTPCIVFPESGDVHVQANMSDESVADALSKGAQRARRMKKRVKWVVSTYCTTLHDDYSPYAHFTVVPYFAYFRRGKTRGMVDNGIGPQEVLNKSVSQFVHILNSSANGGWMVEEGSLTNMDTDDLEEVGAKTGLVVEYSKAAKNKPERIQPNSVPTGVDRLMDRAQLALKETTVPDAMRGNQGQEVSGIAIQSKQHASQQQLAVPLDNLAYTRWMLAKRLLHLIQTFYDSYRVFRITETDPITGKDKDVVLEINKFDATTGSYLNDVTVGEYDVVISEQPMQVTFENSQFQQVMEMRNAGIQIPDRVALRYSNLADKHELIDALPDPANQPADPTLEAKAQLLQSQARLADANAQNKDMQTLYTGLQTAQVIATTPQTAPLADKLARSVGFQDKDAAPIIPESQAMQPVTGAVDMGTNTSPAFPALPATGGEGAAAGIETLAADGVQQL
ncbi:genomic island protein [Comamonas aquatica]|nr:genomic island protein [Comamonas aquatica]